VDATPLILFAQKGGGGGGEAAAGIIGFAFICLMIVAYVIAPLIGLALAIWFYVTTYSALNAVSPNNRDMEPGMVFLMLIPCFGIVWFFFVIIRVASSLRKEYDDRGIREDGDFGQLMGILSGVLPCVNLVTLPMYLMKIAALTKRLHR
jgi:hypothetical protein